MQPYGRQDQNNSFDYAKMMKEKESMKKINHKEFSRKIANWSMRIMNKEIF